MGSIPLYLGKTFQLLAYMFLLFVQPRIWNTILFIYPRSYAYLITFLEFICLFLFSFVTGTYYGRSLFIMKIKSFGSQFLAMNIWRLIDSYRSQLVRNKFSNNWNKNNENEFWWKLTLRTVFFGTSLLLLF